MANYGNIRVAFTSAMKLYELEFKSYDEFDQYLGNLKTGKTRPDTKVVIAGKEVGTLKDAKEKRKSTDKLSKSFDAIKNQVAFTNDQDEEVTIGALKKLINGEEVSKEEMDTFNKYIKLKDTIEGSSEVSFYLASKEPGNFKQNSRLKIELGGGAAANKLRKEFEDKGVELTDPTTTGADTLKIGGKDVAPNKISTERQKMQPKVEKAEDGTVSKVTVGGHEIKRMSVPTDLRDSLKKNNPDASAEDLDFLEERIQTGIERNNALMEQYAELGEVEMIDTVPGADVNTDEGRQQIAKEYPAKIAKAFEERLGDNPTKAEKELLEDIKKLGQIEDAEEFETASIRIIEKMGAIDSVRKGSSDLAESMVYLTMVKKGNPVYLPASANMTVSDIVAFPDLTDLDPNDKNYSDKLASNMKYLVNLETQGGVSVKKDGGAASAARAKIENTMFKNEETAAKLTGLVDNYENIMGTAKRSTDHAKAEQTLNETKQWAKDNGLWDGEPLSAGKNVGTPREWAEKQVEKWQKEGKLKGSPEHVQKVTKSLELHAEQALLLAQIYNADCRGQYFGNVNMDTKKDKLEVTDGVKTASLMEPLLNSGYSFREDKEGNVWPVPINVYAARMMHSEWNPAEKRYEPAKH